MINNLPAADDNERFTQLKARCLELCGQHKLRHIDLHMAEQVIAYEHDLSDQQRIILYLLVVLLSDALAKGQVCLPLSGKHASSSDNIVMMLPELAVFWPKGIVADQVLSECVSVYCYRPDQSFDEQQDFDEHCFDRRWENQPLVLDLCYPQARLYLARYYFYELAVYRSVQLRLSTVQESASVNPNLKQTLHRLFVPRSDNTIDWQSIAAATACLQRFTVITGGPGTGKTTTVTRLLSALLSQQPEMSIALAAPTGKAAARMTESIRGAKLKAAQEKETSGGELPLAERIPDNSFTLHRLLGWSPRGFRYHQQHPLPYDCVVVDEASMIDLPMMSHLLQALSDDTRLILLGDRDQLASVEAGSVLADLCDAGQEHGLQPAFAEQLQKLTGQDLSAYKTQNRSLMQNALAQLRVSHRFDANSGIGQLAGAVNNGDVNKALRCFNHFSDIDIFWHRDSSADDVLQSWQPHVLKGYRHFCKTVIEQGSRHNFSAILEAFNDFQVLLATRQGLTGVEAVNQRIEQLLRPQLDPQQQYSGAMYPGRAIMISRNDYDLGLFNGDIGIVVEVPGDVAGEKKLKVAFQSLDQGQSHIRLLMSNRLPEHETAFAMTVHKSQGSEFNNVFMMLPQQWQSVITRELIYTAITRAKHHFSLLTSMHSLQTGVVSQVRRASGLRDRLWEEPKG